MTGMENLAGERVWCADEVLGLGNSIETLCQKVEHVKFLHGRESWMSLLLS